MKPIYILGLLTLLLASCNHFDEPQSSHEEDCVELMFKVSTSAINSRGNVSDYPNNPSQWSQAEKAIDGRYLYNLSVYLVDENKQIVASQKNITISDQATYAIVTFDKSYNLKKGNYTLMAVANNINHTIESTTYQSGATNWKDNSYTELINNTIATTADNVSAKNVIQPLSLMKDITLQYGKNQVTGELSRTISRLRIVVENNSSILPLQINNLTFSDNFTQKQAYVFDDGTNRKYFGNTGAPVATSSYALHPFTTNTDENTLSINPYSSTVVYDGYMLESQVSDNDTYQYTLDLAYKSEAVSQVSDEDGPWIEVRNPADIADGEYLICDYASYIYITTLNKTTEAGTTYGTYFYKNAEVDDAHVWVISKTSDGKYYIKNKATGQYMQDPTTSYVGLNANNPFAFTISSHSHSSYTNYLEIKGSSLFLYPTYFYLYGSSSYSSSSRIILYRRASQTPPATSITFNEPITLTTIDHDTHQAKVTKVIRRNDFIDIHVTVSYNTVAGNIDFEVRDWTEVNGDVEFD